MITGYDLDPHSASANAAQAEYVERSTEAAALEGAQLDIAYGADPRQKLDIFSVGADAPVLVFFHGGFWRAGSKDTRRFPALAWLPRGVSWVVVNYRLLPDNPLSTTTTDARAAVAWLAKNGAAHGINPKKMHVTGNSAGGHLAAMIGAQDWADRPPIASLILISGLFDLAPLCETEANTWLGMEAAQVQQLSPVHHLPQPDIPVLIGWGGSETDVFEWQSHRYGEACRANGNPVDLFDSPGKDHFQIIAEYGNPGTPLFTRLEALIAKSA